MSRTLDLSRMSFSARATQKAIADISRYFAAMRTPPSTVKVSRQTHARLVADAAKVAGIPATEVAAILWRGIPITVAGE